MLDFEVIRILFWWTLIVIGVPGIVFQQALVRRIHEMPMKAFAWCLFVLAEVALHVMVIGALVRRWTI